MKKKILVLGFWSLLLVLITGVWLFASGTYRYPIPRGPGVVIGDILYVARNDMMTNLTTGSNGQVLQANGSATAPSYVAKNIWRKASLYNFATGSATWTLTADQQLCLYLACTNAGAAARISAPVTAGATFILRNNSGYNVTVSTPSAGTGVTVPTGAIGQVYYDPDIGDYIRAGTFSTWTSD